MSIGIDKDVETIPFQITLMDREVLRVTADGQFVWHPDADRMIEEGDFSHSPALPFILRALRKRKWVGLTDELKVILIKNAPNWTAIQLIEETELLLKGKNT